MLMRKLGGTGLKVAALCLGGNTFGWTTDQKASEAVLDAYVEAGGNFIDTADVYSRWAPGNKGGESETVLGHLDGGAQATAHAVVIATKVCGPMGDGPERRRPLAPHIMEAVEASLRRLQTDYIDLYQAHWDDRTRRSRRRCAPSTTWSARARCATSAARTTTAWRLTEALWESATRHGYARYECAAAASTTWCSATSTSASSSRSVSSSRSA